VKIKICIAFSSKQSSSSSETSENRELALAAIFFKNAPGK
jgi:hypothetical protein